MKKYLLSAACYLLSMPLAHAVCPICTVAVGAGLTFLEVWGVDLVLAGIWAGAFTLIMVFWTAKWMNKMKLKSAWWYVIDIVAWYGFMASIYMLPNFRFGGQGNTLFGIDKLALGIIVGTIVLYAAEKWNARIIRENGGKSKWKGQKIWIPFGFLSLVTLIFAGILYL